MQSDAYIECGLTTKSITQVAIVGIFKENRINSSQVAALLEDHIAKGKLKPGERLKSTRALASDFGVGQRVIISALDILGWKKLVKRKERYGVYVCHPSRTPEIKEVMILTIGGTPSDNNFIRVISEFMHLPESKERYDFFVRFIPGKDAHQRVDAELERMEKFGYPDCILIVGLRFCRAEIEKALSLSYPVLFLGNFMEGDYSDLKYNRLGGNNFTPLRGCVDYALKKEWKNVMLFCNQGYAGHDAFSKALKKTEQFARKNKINLSTRVISGKNEELPEKFAENLARQRENDTLPDLLIFTGADSVEFQKKLNTKKINYPKELDIICLDDTSYFKHPASNYNAFYDEMRKAIDIICEDGNEKKYGIKDVDIMKGIEEDEL